MSKPAGGNRPKEKLHIHQSRLGKVVSMSGGPVTLQIPDGPVIIAEEMPWLQSASLGFFYPRGSVHEPSKIAGISHFIEHLLFKGTKTRSPRDIALAFEGVGGVLNASTGKELMNVHGRIGSRYVKRGFKVIADMILHPRFSRSDIEKERGVILEEIRMNRDIPEQYLYEEFSKQVWGKNPVARPNAGFEKTLISIDKDTIEEYYKRTFCSRNLVISVAGNVDVKSVAGWWLDVSGNKKMPVPLKKIPGRYMIKPVVPSWNSDLKVYRREVEQATVIFGFPAPGVRDESRYSIMIIEAVLGGGMGSRLFQQIREKLGIVYDIDIGYSPMRGAGVITIYSATAPHLFMNLIEKILVELSKLTRKKVGVSELKRVKDYLEGSTFLGMESSANRMLRNSLGYLYLGRLIPTEDVITKLEAVTSDDVLVTSRKSFAPDKISCGVLLPKSWGDDKAVINQIESLIKKIL